jgi:hypothetical protein
MIATHPRNPGSVILTLGPYLFFNAPSFRRGV